MSYQSTFSQSGSTQNLISGQGSGQIAPPVPNVAPAVYLPAAGGTIALNQSESGSVIVVPALSNAAVLNLPYFSLPGLNYTLLASATVGQTCRLTCPTGGNVMTGLIFNAATGAEKAAAAYGGFTATAVAGDQYKIVSNGVGWTAQGFSAAVAGVV